VNTSLTNEWRSAVSNIPVLLNVILYDVMLYLNTAIRKLINIFYHCKSILQFLPHSSKTYSNFSLPVAQKSYKLFFSDLSYPLLDILDKA